MNTKWCSGSPWGGLFYWEGVDYGKRVQGLIDQLEADCVTVGRVGDIAIVTDPNLAEGEWYFVDKPKGEE